MENNTLVIERVKKDDEGHYECKAVNEMGQDSAKAFIRIQGEVAREQHKYWIRQLVDSGHPRIYSKYILYTF